MTNFSTGRGGDSSRISGKTVRLAASPGRGGAGITTEQVHRALESIFKLNGCPSCGLLGIDILIHGGDPEPFLGDVAGFNASIR
jgi:hypothetical protein